MSPLRSWRRLATLLTVSLSAASLFAAGAAFAQKPGAEPQLVLKEIESGKGWSRLIAVDGNDTKAIPTTLGDLLMVGPDGIEDLPIAQLHKDELYQDFGLANPKDNSLSTEEPSPTPNGGASQELILIDYGALEQIETGIWRPEYLALAEPENEPGEEPLAKDGEQVNFGCSGWKDRDKSKTWSLNNSPLSHNFNLGGGFTGNFAVSLPLVSTGTAKLNYQIKKNFLCIPYKFRVKNVQATGQAALGGNAQLQASASLAYKWEHDWKIAEPELGRVTFFVGFIPVWIDFSLPITAGVKIDAKVTATVAQNFDLGANGAFSYTCTTDSCTGGSTFQDSFTTTGTTGSLQGELEAEANAKVQVRAEVYSGNLLYAQAGVKGFVKAKVWGYYGNNCGDGNGDGQNETVRALLGQVDAGFDIVYGIGGHLAPDHNGSSAGGRYNLGWWDLLGTGGSTVLSPMIAGPATTQVGQNVSYVVKMRPCYPYNKAVDLQMGPGAWSGTLKIAKPQGLLPAENSTTLTRSFPAPGGAQTITATAVKDADNRSLQAATSRTLQVQNPQIYPRGGHWYNPDRSGAGIELFVNMYGDYVAIWYTYDGSEPVWYITDTQPVQNGSWSSTLYRSTWNDATHSNSITQVGSLGFTFSSDSQATLHWSLNGANGDEPYQLLFQGGGRSGSWFPPSESGWGMSIAEDGSVAIVTVQYYLGGQPTWAMGGATPGAALNATMVRHHASNLCPGCTGPIQRWTEDAGTVTITPPPSGYHLLVTTNLPGWQRTSVPFYQLAGH